ncbi:ABC transporter substrate-binding protein [Brevibacillus fluminis]|uniref:ABC transporter substrate-binding protein n=1 Tax=Brevibacillus fluminis TaxID=511487 RepID=A0A3M8DN86_9BACL|nr:ABC transporter substrate-binding protein [Brevibacillus fluminis]RNB89474.1 ABC transporter substrate-binding protein [Brevibacillus fluminis]
MKRLTIGLLAVLLLSAAACSKQEAAPGGTTVKKEQQLVISIPAEPGPIDPAVTVDNSAYKLGYYSYERLLEYDGEKTDLVPGLSKKWEVSPDSKVYTFTLEQGHKFADGTEVNADAVKFTFDRLLKIGKGPSDSFNMIDEIKVLDPYKVEFTLKEPYPVFLPRVAGNYGSIVNPKVMEHEKDGDLAQGWLAVNTAGSGPYQLAEYKKGRYYKYIPNPNSAKKPKIGTVYFQINSDVSATRLKLTKGEIDIAEGIPIEQLLGLEKVPELELIKAPSLMVDYIYMNIGKGNEALKDKKVRQAISYATNYQSVIKNIQKDTAIPFRGPIPEGLWGHDENAKMYNYDVDKAKQLLSESGKSGIELTLLYTDNVPMWEPMALALQNDLAQIGIKVKLNKVAYATMREMLDKGEFDLSFGRWVPDTADPLEFMTPWFDSKYWGLSGNRSFYKNDEVDKLVREAASLQDKEQRLKLYQDVTKIVNEDAVYVYLDQRQYVLPISKKVQGFKYNPMLEGVYNLQDMSISE